MSRPRSYPAITVHSLRMLPHWLTAKRKRLGLSERQAAALIGVSRPTLHRLEETGDAYPAALIKAFGWLDGPGKTNSPGGEAGAVSEHST
jgi:Helix-turn-helix